MPDEDSNGYPDELDETIPPAAAVITDYSDQIYSPVTDAVQTQGNNDSGFVETALDYGSQIYQSLTEYGSVAVENMEQAYIGTSTYVENLSDTASMQAIDDTTDSSTTLSDDTGCSDISFGCTTQANFSYTNSAPSYKTSPATGCDGCKGADCVRVSGTITITYTVTTTIGSMPTVASYPKLKLCQKERLKKAINDLKKHEDEHAKRFKTYNGTETLNLNFIACRDDIESKIIERVSAAATAHQSKAQAFSDAIDNPSFTVVVDCDC